MKLTSDGAFLYYELGTAYVLGGDEEEALTAYKKALELDTNPFPTWYDR